MDTQTFCLHVFGQKKTKIPRVIWISLEKKKKKYLLLWWIFRLDFVLVLHKHMLFITCYCIIAVRTFFRVEKVTWVCEKSTQPHFSFCTTCLLMIFNDSQRTLLVTSDIRQIHQKIHHLRICWFRHSSFDWVPNRKSFWNWTCFRVGLNSIPTIKNGTKKSKNLEFYQRFLPRVASCLVL